LLKVLVLVFLLASCASVARAQGGGDDSGFELGGQLTAVGLDRQGFVGDGALVCTSLPCAVIAPRTGRTTEWGGGGRVGYHFNRYVGVEAEVNFFPDGDPEAGGSKIEGLFGAKVGHRGERVGVFAKARPGFLRSDAGEFQPLGHVCAAIFPPPPGCFEEVETTSFAFDVGGVVEFYPSKRAILRLDVGDTIVRYPERNVIVEITPVPVTTTTPASLRTVARAPAETTHNFQGSVGVGFRF
jgi:hypothetical protein